MKRTAKEDSRIIYKHDDVCYVLANTTHDNEYKVVKELPVIDLLTANPFEMLVYECHNFPVSPLSQPYTHDGQNVNLCILLADDRPLYDCPYISHNQMKVERNGIRGLSFVCKKPECLEEK